LLNKAYIRFMNNKFKNSFKTKDNIPKYYKKWYYIMLAFIENWIWSILIFYFTRPQANIDKTYFKFLSIIYILCFMIGYCYGLLHVIRFENCFFIRNKFKLNFSNNIDKVLVIYTFIIIFFPLISFYIINQANNIINNFNIDYIVSYCSPDLILTLISFGIIIEPIRFSINFKKIIISYT